MTEILAGLTLGVAGSVHCVAMCGPLVLALRPVRTAGRVALYHGARVAIYTLAGLVGGLLGHTLQIAGFGRALSIAAGVLLLAAAARRAGLGLPPHAGRWIGKALQRAMSTSHRYAAARPTAGALAAGALNALLPCGLVYAALAAATAAGSPRRAAVFMLAFGLGTMPALAAMSLLARTVPAALRARLRFAAPLALAAVGLLLIVRGMPLPPSHGPHAAHQTAHQAAHAHR